MMFLIDTISEVVTTLFVKLFNVLFEVEDLLSSKELVKV
jgi:hypothetical protein